ncbi:hypothetical protein E2C01_074366 [Portunus trituberculatus]|uniref:Uncharacterized protein n=1 Tax=Portunus trituberculatus TaxID=210409 RepID=A0A5B7I5H6_PORTR|nr:hypothetical protein [Portunus trituberculatus]
MVGQQLQTKEESHGRPLAHEVLEEHLIHVPRPKQPEEAAWYHVADKGTHCCAGWCPLKGREVLMVLMLLMLLGPVEVRLFCSV